MLAENFFHSPSYPTIYILKISLNIRPTYKKSLHRYLQILLLKHLKKGLYGFQPVYNGNFFLFIKKDFR